MSEIKPCPFCGGEATLVDVQTLGQREWETCGYKLRCRGCSVQMPEFPTVPQVIAAWNRRAGDATAVTDIADTPPSWPFEPTPEDLATEFDPDKGSDSE